MWIFSVRKISWFEAHFNFWRKRALSVSSATERRMQSPSLSRTWVRSTLTADDLKHTEPKRTLTDLCFCCNWEENILAEEFVICSGLANELSPLPVLLKLHTSVCLTEVYWSNLTSALSMEELTQFCLVGGSFLRCCRVCLEARLCAAHSSAVSSWWSMAGWSVS